MRQSNLYIIIFTVIVTVVCAGLLAGVAVALKPMHEMQVELDKKTMILKAVMEIPEGSDILALYEKNIVEVVLNAKGEEITELDGKTIVASNVDIRKEYKKSNPADKLLPLFKYLNEVKKGEVESYILPVYGNGLWDNIWGYVALSSDFNTIQGVVFDHKAETPGLGARITDNKNNTNDGDNAFQERFRGKEIFDAAGKLVSVKVIKGEKNPIDPDDKHNIDGLSGSSMTTSGLNKMLMNYFTLYQPYIQKNRSTDKSSVALN